MTNRLWVVLAVLLVAVSSLAQMKRVEAVQVAPPAKPLTATPGGTLEVTLDLGIKSGFHINSDKPTFEYMIPTKLDWTSKEVKPVAVRYPVPEQREFEFAPGEKLSVYQGEIRVVSRFEVPKTAAPGKLSLHGKLRYQACDNKACYPPVTTPVEVPVEIVKKK